MRALPAGCFVSPSARLYGTCAITRYSHRGERKAFSGCWSMHQLAEHIVQNAAVLEIFELVERIDPAQERHAHEMPIGRHDLGHHALARLDLAVQATDRHLFVALDAKRLPGSALLEAERKDAHADQV